MGGKWDVSTFAYSSYSASKWFSNPLVCSPFLNAFFTARPRSLRTGVFRGLGVETELEIVGLSDVRYYTVDVNISPAVIDLCFSINTTLMKLLVTFQIKN